MRIKLALLLAVGLICGRSFGQERERREVTVAGMVCDRDSLNPLPDAVWRLDGKMAGVDEEGRFGMTVRVGDTIRFSHVGYAPVELVVADSLVKEDYLLGVFMSRDTVMLAEVLILPRFLELEARLNPLLQNAYRNLDGAMWAAARPVDKMDREMNQRMQIEEFARRVEMKGMVDVRFGVGLHTFQALKTLQAGRGRGEMRLATPMELDLLKRVFNAEKKGK